VVSPVFKRFPDNMKVLNFPVYAAGWRFLDIRRYGRDHRKILVVDDTVGFVGGYNIGRRTRRSGATPTSASPGRACGT
jgi:cardiolipin synthase